MLENIQNLRCKDQPRPNISPGFSQHDSKPAWEVAIKKLTNASLQRFNKIEERLYQLTTTQRNLEIQISPVAQTIYTGNQWELSSNIEINPRKHVEQLLLEVVGS